MKTLRGLLLGLVIGAVLVAAVFALWLYMTRSVCFCVRNRTARELRVELMERDEVRISGESFRLEADAERCIRGDYVFPHHSRASIDVRAAGVTSRVGLFRSLDVTTSVTLIDGGTVGDVKSSVVPTLLCY